MRKKNHKYFCFTLLPMRQPLSQLQQCLKIVLLSLEKIYLNQLLKKKKLIIDVCTLTFKFKKSVSGSITLPKW